MTASLRLYEIAEMRDTLDVWLAETEGELTPELESLLNEWNETVEAKIERVALFIREQLAVAKAVKEEEDRLVARRKALERAAESLRGYLHAQMDRMGKTRVTGTLATVTLQPNSQPSVHFAGDADAAYREHGVHFAERIEHVEYKLNRAALIKTWKAGGELPAGVAVEIGSHVHIR